MIIGVGTDLVDIARFAKSLERTPTLRSRLFTPTEADLPVESLAARFAAKEALAKVLGAPAGLSWQDVSVVTDEDGKPHFRLSGPVAALVGDHRLHLSLSHDGGVALAFIVLES